MRVAYRSVLSLTIFSLIALIAQSPAAAQSWANGCLYRRAITIDHTKVPNTDQANFPVLISGTYSYLATTANGGGVTNANGYDILFASDANGANPLSFELESYNPSTGAIAYWVKLSTLSHTTDTVFYMFYGNSSISTNQSNSAAVWDSNYKGVWHLPNGTTLTANDSTSNGNNGTIMGATSTSGEIDGAASLSGSGQYINVGNSSSLQITGSTLTIEAWLKTSESNPSQWERIIAKEVSGNNDPYMVYGIWRTAGSNLLNFGIATGGAGTLGGVTSVSSMPMGPWTHVVGTYDGSTLKMYLNGSLDSQASKAGNITTTSQNVVLGGDTTVNGEYFNGGMDEVRISNSARSADWIATEYANQSSPSTFYSVGSVAQGTITVSITGLLPSTVNLGDTVTMQGQNFGDTQGNNTVSLNGTTLVPQSWSDTQIVVNVPVGGSTGYFSVTANSQTAVSPILFVRPLTSGWSDGDVGSVGLAGSASYANGTFTVQGSGQGVVGGYPYDAFHFLYRTLSGDGTIVARIVSLPQGASAGVMIRETLDQSSTHGYTSGYSGRAYFNYRTSTGGANSYDYNDGNTLPVWVKLVRTGNTFKSYWSPDGDGWFQVGTTQTITMAQSVYIGLAVANNSALATVTFDGVSVSSTAAPGPTITSTSATTGTVGSQVLINGSGFGASQNGSLATLNDVPVTVNSWTNTSIVITIPSGATSGPLLVSVQPSMNDSNSVDFTVTTQPLPTPWLDQDVGLVGIAGTAGYASGSFTVNAAGQGTPSPYTSDSFHFVYQPLSGDGTIVARVVSLPQGVSAGVMIRETLDQSSTHGYTSGHSGRVYFDYRTSTGSANSYDYNGGNTLPVWVKLVRTGNSFNSYWSPDGESWYQVGTTQTITMAQSVYIGLAVASGNSSSLATATFDSVSVSSTAAPGPTITSTSATTGTVGSQVLINGSGFGASQNGSLATLNDVPVTVNSWTNTSIVITIPSGATSGPLLVSVQPSMNDSNSVDFTVTTQPLPTPWLDQDVGLVGIAGTAGYASGTFTVNGAGQGTQSSNTADAFHFVYQPLSGDGTIVARVVSAATSTMAGVMIRETLDQSSTYGYTILNGGTPHFYWRTTTGGTNADDNISGESAPYWMKIVRTGNSLNAYASPDGIAWTQIGSTQTISMAQNVYAGLGVASGTTSALATATFDHVSFSVGTSPFVTGVSPVLGPISTSVTITGSNFGATQGNSTVSFSGVLATSITSWSSSQIVATVPGTAPSGPGLVTATVNSISSPSNITFDVIEPTISSFTPPAASVGGIVTMSGSGFGSSQGNSTVQINGVVASTRSWSDASVTLVVPSGATSGPVTVTEDAVTSNGVQFTVLEPLAVTGVSPSSGPVGTTVTISGAGFGSTQSSSTLSFYGVAATNIHSWSDTQIVATFPSAASTGPAMVRVASSTVVGPTFTLTTSVQITDSLGNPTTYNSQQTGGMWVASSSQGSGCSSCTMRGTISNSYDSLGNVLTKTDENGHTTTYTYDSNGNVLTVTVPITSSTSATTTYTYNSFGEVLTTTDPLGNVTTNTYDSNGNLLTVTTPVPSSGVAASVTHFAYNSLGELTQITDPLGNLTKLTYTTAGLIATVTDAQNNVTTYGYDSHGNRTSVTDAMSNQTTFAFDTGDRLKTITYPGGSITTTFAYDYRGRRTSVTDQNGKTTTYAYDDADRLTSVKDAANNVTTYGYDAENNLTSIEDANSHTTSFTYDAFGRVTKTTFPSGYVETYGYDAVGNLTGKTDRKNQQITYTFDQLNRLTAKTYPDSTAVNYTYDNDSRLTQVTDPTGTYQFTFDNMGRLTNTTTSYAFLTGRNFTTNYSYDAVSNRTGFTDPESGATSYVYDTLNRLQTLTPPSAFSGTGNFGFTYDALSRRTQMTRPNGLKSVYAYDTLSRLLSVLHQSGSTTLDGASYTVDNAGNRTAKTDQLASVTSNYTYDPIYELTQVTQAATTTESYSYDAVGNRLSSLGVSSYTNNSSNELTATSSTSYTYDYNGNTLTKEVGSNTTSYAWDFENRLTSVTLPGTGGTVSFKYDPLGRRIYKSSSAGTSIYAYDGDNLIEETNVSGTVIARYSQNANVMDEPLAMLRGGTTSYYNADGLNSITSLSNGTGSLIQTYGYDSFGRQTSSSGSLTNPFLYTAREFDAETSLYFYRARYYDQTLGRFLSEDPIGFSNDTYNLYNYVSGDPVDFNDPSGNKKIHGNWCGPNWTGGQVEPFIPSNDKDGYYKDPRDYVDKVCSFHDKCYAKCRDKHPCSPLGRSLCSRKCDFFLVGRLVGNPKDAVTPVAYLIGAGIALNLVPLPGPNGGAEPYNNPSKGGGAKCCSQPPPAGAGSR